MFSYKWRCNGEIRIGRNYQKNAIFTKIRIDSGRMMEEAVRLSLASPNSNCLSPFHPFLYLVIPGPSLSVLARLGPSDSESITLRHSAEEQEDGRGAGGRGRGRTTITNDDAAGGGGGDEIGGVPAGLTTTSSSFSLSVSALSVDRRAVAVGGWRQTVCGGHGHGSAVSARPPSLEVAIPPCAADSARPRIRAIALQWRRRPSPPRAAAVPGTTDSAATRRDGAGRPPEFGRRRWEWDGGGGGGGAGAEANQIKPTFSLHLSNQPARLGSETLCLTSAMPRRFTP